MLEIKEIIVQSLLKTSRRQYKIVAAFTSDFVAKVNIGKFPGDRGCLLILMTFGNRKSKVSSSSLKK